MKKYFLLLIILTPLFSSAQFFENKLNVGFEAGYPLVLNRKTLNDNDFRYPSLWRNYNRQYCFSVNATYKYNKRFWGGLNLQQIEFNDFYNSNENFILINPTSSLSRINIELLYLPLDIFDPLYFKWGISIGTNVTIYQLSWDLINNSSSGSVYYPNSSTYSGIGFSLGFFADKEFTNRLGCTISCKYNISQSKSYYIIDKWIHALELKAGLYLKLYHNKELRNYE